MDTATGPIAPKGVGCLLLDSFTLQLLGECARLVQENPDIPSNTCRGALTTGRDGSLLVPTDKGLCIGREGNLGMVDDHRRAARSNEQLGSGAR